MLRIALGRVDAELGWRQREDQPAGMILDVLPAEDVTEDRAHRLRFVRVQQHVRCDNRHQSALTSCESFVIDSFASPNSITVFGL